MASFFTSPRLVGDILFNRYGWKWWETNTQNGAFTKACNGMWSTYRGFCKHPQWDWGFTSLPGENSMEFLLNLVGNGMGYTLWWLSAMENHHVEEVDHDNHGTQWAMVSIAMLNCRRGKHMKDYWDSRVSNLTDIVYPSVIKRGQVEIHLLLGWFSHHNLHLPFFSNHVWSKVPRFGDINQQLRNSKWLPEGLGMWKLYSSFHS